MFQVWRIDFWLIWLIEMNYNLLKEEFCDDASLYVEEIIKSYFISVCIFVLLTDVVPVAVMVPSNQYV